MESIVSKLLEPSSEVIAQGTAELKEVWKRAEALPEMCSLMTSSARPQVRQYAALLIRKKMGKAAGWNKLEAAAKETIKAGVLHALTQEADKSVQLAQAQLLGVLAKHELHRNPSGWPELKQFLETTMAADATAPMRLLGLYTFAALCETSGATMKQLLPPMLKPLARALDQEGPEAGFYAVRALTHLVPHVGTDELNNFQVLVPHVIQFVTKLVASGEEDRATEAMEIFDELIESEVGIVIPHIKPIVELSLKVAAQPELDDALRSKAISFLGRLTRLKKKTIVKHKLYLQMMTVLFPIMCHIDEDEDEEDEDLAESNTPATNACQTMDVLAINLPPEKYMAALLPHIQPALTAGCTDPALMKGAFTALAVSAEGCSENIRTKYLGSFLEVIFFGIKHENKSVRHAALYALGQFSEYLQPDISKCADQIFPVLFHYIDQTISLVLEQGQPEGKGLDRVFYALEIFSENMSEQLVPYLPEIMKRLLLLLGDKFAVHSKELALSAIGATAEAVKSEIVPYFEEIMVHLKKYLSFESDMDTQMLMMQSMDTLATLARTVGPTGFAPSLATDCCRLGLDLVAKHDDPDVRKCAFALFGAVAVVVREEMASVLPQITHLFFTAMRSKEGISFEFGDEGNPLPVDELSEDEAEVSIGTDDTNEGNDSLINTAMEGIKAIKVENAYMEEKEQAVIALKDICQNAGAAFAPYLAEAVDQTKRALHMPDDDLKQAAVEALAEYTIAYFKLGNAQEFNALIAFLIPELCQVVRNEEEVMVVCRALENLAKLLKECGQPVTSVEGHPEQLLQCIHWVMKSECACQDNDPYEDSEEDEQEAEQDEVVFEYAGEILPALGGAMTPATFAPYFAGILPHLLKKARKQCSESERSFSAGNLAECMRPLADPTVILPFVATLLPTFTNMTKDRDDDVRNNAVFGLGELALCGREAVFDHYPAILQTFSALLGHEQNPRVIDQIVSGVCRLVVANRSLVPVKEVLPVVFQHLPLKEDYEEYHMVFRCLQGLYSAGEDLIKENASKILHLCGTLYGTKAGKESEQTEPAILELVKSFARDIPDCAALVAQLPPDIAAKINAIVAM